MGRSHGDRTEEPPKLLSRSYSFLEEPWSEGRGRPLCEKGKGEVTRSVRGWKRIGALARADGLSQDERGLFRRPPAEEGKSKRKILSEDQGEPGLLRSSRIDTSMGGKA